jgi:mutator protein MutT
MPESTQIAGVILRNEEGNYLLVQEGQGEAEGLWNLPAGHVDAGETPQQAAIREALEEVGYTVQLISDEPLVIDRQPKERRIKYAFLAEIVSGTLAIPRGELMDAQWLAVSSLQKLYQDGMVRSQWVMSAILKAENENLRH